MVKATYPVRNGSTSEKGPGTDLDRSRSHVNEKDRSFLWNGLREGHKQRSNSVNK